jgi:hypothetical protein
MPLMEGLALSFVAMNLELGVFNLVPAVPPDGGRILRALLARKGDWIVATQRAVMVGRVFAVVLAVVGIVFGNWMLPLVALWLWWMGSLELAGVRARRARDAMMGAAQAYAASAADPAAPSRTASSGPARQRRTTRRRTCGGRRPRPARR